MHINEGQVVDWRSRNGLSSDQERLFLATVLSQNVALGYKSPQVRDENVSSVFTLNKVALKQAWFELTDKICHLKVRQDMSWVISKDVNFRLYHMSPDIGGGKCF